MKNRTRVRKTPLALLLICLSTPLSMGGCPNLQNELAAAFQSAFVAYVGEIIAAFFEELPRE
jgi:hypothetical protein